MADDADVKAQINAARAARLAKHDTLRSELRSLREQAALQQFAVLLSIPLQQWKAIATVSE